VATSSRQRAVESVERICARAETADELLEGLAHELHRAIPYDGAAWFGIDPVTMLAAAPSRIEDLDPSYCSMYWHLEFHEQDFANFTDLAERGGVTSLRQSLGDRPGRSVRYREFMAPQGYHDELRATFRIGDATWGFVDLYRESSALPFTDDDLGLMRAISAVVADSLRTHVRSVNPWLGEASAPGLLVVDGEGRAVSSNGEAEVWLRDLWPAAPDGANASLDFVDLGQWERDVPTPLYALAARARAVAGGRERVPARLRLRDRRGRWLVLHASALTDRDNPDRAQVAIVIEAAKSAEVAPIIIEAYSLTPRERDVLGAIARGGSTGEIATALFLSPHTVRDYVKAVFEKVGVSSRNELVAKLFGEHYSDRLHETMVEIH
jgi:DNA-binding CsgD family transcriptional regulator